MGPTYICDGRVLHEDAQGPEVVIGLVIPEAKETHVTGVLGDQVQENDVTQVGKISLQ